MIRVALFLIAAVSLTCLAFTPLGWGTVALAVLGGVPTIALIILWREPAPKRPVSQFYDLSRLDRLDGVGNRTKDSE